MVVDSSQTYFRVRVLLPYAVSVSVVHKLCAYI